MNRIGTGVLLSMALCWGCSSQQPAKPVPVTWLELGSTRHEARLLKGFHRSEGAWRWTEQVFSVALDPLSARRPVYLDLDLAMPHEVMNTLQPITLRARVNGVEVGSETYERQGRYTFLKPVPAAALKPGRAIVEFALDKAARPGGPSGKQLGLIAVSVGFKRLDETEVFRQEQVRKAQEGYRQVLRQRDLKLSTAKQHELMKLFHDLEVWQHLWFQGIQLIKNPCDLWMMQDIIYELRPDYIIETGTWFGGSALYWAHTLHGMGLENSRVLTVDLQNVTQEASQRPLWKKYVQFFQASSTDRALVRRFAEMVKGKTVLVTLDSDHTMNHVLEELRLYAPLVSPGSYLVVEDTHMDSLTYPGYAGPTAALNRFFEEGGDKLFERDLTREAMVMTFNPGGWLRRKK